MESRKSPFGVIENRMRNVFNMKVLAHKITQESISKNGVMTQGTASKVKNGCNAPNIEHFAKFCTVYRIKPETIFDEELYEKLRLKTAKLYAKRILMRRLRNKRIAKDKLCIRYARFVAYHWFKDTYTLA